MQQYTFGRASEMVRFASYQADTQTLYLTYHSGGTTIAYGNVSPDLYAELCRSPYPDVCIRFKIQAHHPFRRIEPGIQTFDVAFLK